MKIEELYNTFLEEIEQIVSINVYNGAVDVYVDAHEISRTDLANESKKENLAAFKEKITYYEKITINFLLFYAYFYAIFSQIIYRYRLSISRIIKLFKLAYFNKITL